MAVPELKNDDEIEIEDIYCVITQNFPKFFKV